MNGSRTVDAVEEIAVRVIGGQMDPLTGCREVLRIRPSLPEVPDEVWGVFSAVASEIDDLPLGEEREVWDRDVLESKDREVEDYRRRIHAVVVQAFEELRASLKR